MDTDKSIRFEHPSQFRRRPFPLASRFWQFLILCAVLGLLFFCYRNLSYTISHRGELDLATLGDFEFDGEHGTTADVPEKIRKLDGHRFRIQGFMWAGASSSPDVTDFQLVYHITEYGGHRGPPLVQERIFCHVAGGKSVPYYEDWVQVTGILHVHIENPTGDKVISVFQLDAENVAPEGPDASK
jgi:hypothetical protein